MDDDCLLQRLDFINIFTYGADDHGPESDHRRRCRVLEPPHVRSHRGRSERGARRRRGGGGCDQAHIRKRSRVLQALSGRQRDKDSNTKSLARGIVTIDLEAGFGHMLVAGPVSLGTCTV